MIAVVCTAADGTTRRRLVDLRDVVAMTRTETEVVLTVACPCGEFHEHRIARVLPQAGSSVVQPAAPVAC